jgi:hypothetical protein
MKENGQPAKGVRGEKGQRIYFILAGLAAALVVSIIILSSVPPVCRDSLTHHLAVPKLYLNHGGIYEIPSVIFSYYPMNLELLYLIPLYFGNDIVPKYIHFVFALLTALLVFEYLKKRTDKIFALFGSLFFLSIPVIVKLSTTVYVDLGLIFFSTAAIIFLFKWIESGFGLKNLLLSALFCGLALGTKYNALIVFFLLSVFIIFSYSRIAGRNKKNPAPIPKGVRTTHLKLFLFGVLYLFIVLLIFSPWMIRNYIWTKNPVYPLYHGFFIRLNAGQFDQSPDEGDNSVVESKNKNRQGEWNHFAIRRMIYNESLAQMVLIPVRIFFEGEDGNPKKFDGRLSPFLFILPFFAFLRIRQDSPVIRLEKEILFLFSVLFVLFAFAQADMRIRYISPVIPPLVMLSVIGLYDLFTSLKARFPVLSERVLPVCLFITMFAVLSFNSPYIIKQFQLVAPAGYLSGDVSRDEYIEKYRPEYAAIKFANKNLPPDAKILCFFLGNRRYYSDREMLFDETILMNSAKSLKTPDKILSDIKKKRISHFLIWYDEFDKWVNNNFDNSEKVLLRDFFRKNAALLIAKGGYGLYELKESIEH